LLILQIHLHERLIPLHQNNPLSQKSNFQSFLNIENPLNDIPAFHGDSLNAAEFPDVPDFDDSSVIATDDHGRFVHALDGGDHRVVAD
jgi:hypothetical protein